MIRKLIIILFVLLPLLVNVVQVRATEVELDDDLTVVETITTETPIMGFALNASCKTQSHKLSFVTSSGTEVAWIKLNGVNACWSSCMTLQNSTRSKGAASGYYWVLLGAVLGGKTCTTQTFQKYSNAELHMPGKNGYLTHQQMELRLAEPLDYNWSSWKTPVVWP